MQINMHVYKHMNMYMSMAIAFLKWICMSTYIYDTKKTYIYIFIYLFIYNINDGCMYICMSVCVHVQVWICIIYQ